VDERTNSVVLRCSEPVAREARQVVQSLEGPLSVAAQAPAGAGELQVIRLRHATDSEKVAQALEEAFNGPPKAAPRAPPVRRIRVVADPSINALLVQAKPLDLQAVRHLLKKLLDVEEPAPLPPGSPQPSLRLHAVPAGEAKPLAQLLRKVYKADPVTFVLVVDPDSIVVWTAPEWQQALARYFASLRAPKK
jgi:hypothetical protein